MTATPEIITRRGHRWPTTTAVTCETTAPAAHFVLTVEHRGRAVAGASVASRAAHAHVRHRVYGICSDRLIGTRTTVIRMSLFVFFFFNKIFFFIYIYRSIRFNFFFVIAIYEVGVTCDFNVIIIIIIIILIPIMNNIIIVIFFFLFTFPFRVFTSAGRFSFERLGDAYTALAVAGGGLRGVDALD